MKSMLIFFTILLIAVMGSAQQETKVENAKTATASEWYGYGGVRPCYGGYGYGGYGGGAVAIAGSRLGWRRHLTEKENEIKPVESAKSPEWYGYGGYGGGYGRSFGYGRRFGYGGWW